MKSDGPYKHLLDYLPIDGVIRCALVCPACVYAEVRKAAENYTEKMLVCAKDEVRKCHEEIRWLEDKYARNVYKMPGSLENELEEKKAVKDALLCGTGFMKDGKRVPPEDVYLSEAEIKLKKAEKDFKELVELANHMRAAMADIWIVSEEFDAWKKARGIE